MECSREFRIYLEVRKMKLKVYIPDIVYKQNEKDIESLIASFDEALGLIDERTYVEYDEDD